MQKLFRSDLISFQSLKCRFKFSKNVFAASLLTTAQGTEELFVTLTVNCSYILLLIPRIAFAFILWNRVNLVKYYPMLRKTA